MADFQFLNGFSHKLKEYDKEINALLDNNPTAKMLMEQLKNGTLNPVALINANNK